MVFSEAGRLWTPGDRAFHVGCLARHVLCTPRMSGPHDLLARFTFSHPERAAAELRAILPPEVVAQINWDSLCREPTSVVDPDLREKETDILFSSRTLSNQPALFYVLIEHQSSVAPGMALRMARYVLSILERWRQDHPNQPLPVVIPHVIYHGDSAWNAPLRLEELFSIPSPEWLTFVPRFQYSHHDLTTRQAEALMAWAAPAFVRLVYLYLRFSRTEDFARQLSAWESLFRDLLTESDVRDKLLALITYAVQVGGDAARIATQDVLDSVLDAERTEELMRTVGEELIEQGRQKGRAEGKAESVLRILTARGVHVDSQSRQRILSCRDLATLDLWFDRALHASTLSDVLAS